MQVTESIWNEYHNKLHRFIQGRVSDASIADDILQEVIIKVHSRINTLKDSNKIQNWLYRITRNAIIDHYRAQKQMQELPETLTHPKQDTDDKARQEIASCLLPFIQSLPEHYRQTLTLSEIEGLTQKEAKARVQRGRVMMKEMLLRCCRFEFDHQGKMIDYEAKSRSCDSC
jgi:RNA polymerase sigma-70 factor (ECF subfamily)